MTVVTAPEKTPTTPEAPRGARRTVHPLVFNLIALVLGVTIWALTAVAGLADIPGPLSVSSRARELLADGTLTQDALASLQRVLLGFALGTLVAVPVGFLMGWYPVARGLLEPYVQFFRTIPPLALIPW
ncbi:hypothetical protein SANT12839_009400 [Streptomyces antimycoticus]|uniref:ABC transmembrane type-1 domain-containing protein n=1 Tax=Streptomyces antimycoticus TaxID=68175 RepID=A0A4D4K095_9ACTN|nr:hypothetical protein SANT12839_009400 [Streptomyces antimycoticus]